MAITISYDITKPSGSRFSADGTFKYDVTKSEFNGISFGHYKIPVTLSLVQTNISSYDAAEVLRLDFKFGSIQLENVENATIKNGNFTYNITCKDNSTIRVTSSSNTSGSTCSAYFTSAQLSTPKKYTFTVSWTSSAVSSYTASTNIEVNTPIYYTDSSITNFRLVPSNKKMTVSWNISPGANNAVTKYLLAIISESGTIKQYTPDINATSFEFTEGERNMRYTASLKTTCQNQTINNYIRDSDDATEYFKWLCDLFAIKQVNTWKSGTPLAVKTTSGWKESTL